MADLRMWVATTVFNATQRAPSTERPTALAADIDGMVAAAIEDRVVTADEAAQFRELRRRTRAPSAEYDNLLRSMSRPRRLPGPMLPMCVPELQSRCVNGSVQSAATTNPGQRSAAIAFPSSRADAAASRVTRNVLDGMPNGDSAALAAVSEALWNAVRQVVPRGTSIASLEKDRRVEVMDAARATILQSPAAASLSEEQRDAVDNAIGQTFEDEEWQEAAEEKLVELNGIEPSTSAMPLRRSPS
jgi:hypothetical protein